MSKGHLPTALTALGAGASTAAIRGGDAGPGLWVTDTEPPSVDTHRLRAGCAVTDCQQEILHVRRIKTDEEVSCLRLSMAASESAVAAVREAVRPGVSEQELFALMYGEVVRQGGEFIETRLLTSGTRT